MKLKLPNADHMILDVELLEIFLEFRAIKLTLTPKEVWKKEWL